MLDRLLQPEILRLLGTFPAVGLVGARQVGKTTLAKRIISTAGTPAVYLDLERPSDRAKLADPEIYLRQHRDALVVLDEIYRAPALFPVLRSEIDDNRRPGKFLILGSASPDVLRQSSESLAGRIVYRELSGFSLAELEGIETASTKLWMRGGFPLSFSAESDEASFEWRQAFTQTWLERDLPNFGLRISTTTVQRFWQMVAHVNGQLWNAHQMAGSMGVSSPTVARYIDLLQDLFVLRRLAPFHGNLGKRLIKTPKVYFRDTGLLHTLLRITNYEDILAHPGLGGSWEAFCMEQVCQSAPQGSELSFYRTSGGAEVDLVVFAPGARRPVVFECKHSLAPALGRGFHSAIADLEPAHAYVLTPAADGYRLGEDISVLPLNALHTVRWEN